MSDIVVDVHKLKKKINKRTLIHPLSFQVEKGQILALCGGNGAGKSTLIRLIVGLLKATKGKILINGKERQDKQLFLEQIGYMPDDFRFQPSMTAKETITFYARLKKVKPERMKELLQLVGLFEHMDKKMKAFSKGMNQRMLLAQGLLTNPPLLILDEPTNGLDPYWVQAFIDILLEAKGKGQTVIFSTHDLYAAEAVADKVIFLNNGKVISEGNIEKYRSQGLHGTFQQLYFDRRKSS